MVGDMGADGGADTAVHGHHLRPDARVDALAEFQLKCLLHALTFPAAERLSLQHVQRPRS